MQNEVVAATESVTCGASTQGLLQNQDRLTDKPKAGEKGRGKEAAESGMGRQRDNRITTAYIADLVCDLPDVTVDLQVGVADPLVEVQTVINLTDFLLSILGSHHLYHVRHNVDFHLVLFIN